MIQKYYLIFAATCLLVSIPGTYLKTVGQTSEQKEVPELKWPIEVLSGGHGFTEGASVAPDGKIYFSDMDNQKILRFDPDNGKTEVWQDNSGKSNGLYIRNNHLYACEAVGRSIVRYDLSSGPGSREVLVSAYNGDSLGCPNDLTIIENYLYFSEFWIEGSSWLSTDQTGYLCWIGMETPWGISRPAPSPQTVFLRQTEKHSTSQQIKNSCGLLFQDCRIILNRPFRL